MKYRACLAILAAVVLGTVGFAQMPSSRFDLTGNVALGNAQFVSTPGTTGSGNVRAFGWQSSGTSHFNRWLGLTSQFTGGYASANSIQLVGYTGAGSVQHYAMLVGPRITFISRSRFHPFIEGLGGTDYALTRFTSNATIVKGRDFQSAYSAGGGAQIDISRRVGLNVEAHYFETQHTVANLGWTPSHLQISAGLVFKLSNLRDRIIVDQKPALEPSPTTDTQTASVSPTSTTISSEGTVTTTTAVATPPAPVEPVVRPLPVVQATTESQVVRQQPAVAAVVVAQPAAAPAPTVAQFQPSVVNPTAVLSQSHAVQVQAAAQTQAPQPQPAPIARPVVSSYSAPAVSSYSTTPAPVAQAQQLQVQQAAPLSLGEYARRLREKKQQKQTEWQ